jgi:hypothetical protein
MLRGVGVAMLMGFPTWEVACQYVQDALVWLVEQLMSLGSVDSEEKVRGVEEYSPALSEGVHNQGLNFLDVVSGRVVRVDDLVDLKEAIIFGCRHCQQLEGQGCRSTNHVEQVVAWVSNRSVG